MNHADTRYLSDRRDESNLSSFAAIILAAGFSSRMGNAFKPLLSLGNGSVLERVILNFRLAGIRDIRVVVGHKGDDVEAVALPLRARVILNPRYKDGMFSSVAAGLETLEASVQGAFVQPVDIPLVRASTIQTLLAAFEEGSDRILFPVFQGRRGHPPLIPRCQVRAVLAWRGENGLKGALSQLHGHTLDVPVQDEGILKDMDTPEDYREILSRESLGHCRDRGVRDIPG